MISYRAILDVHPNVNCGPETKVLPKLLEFIKRMKNEKSFAVDIENSLINFEKIDEAANLFINHILKHSNNYTYIKNRPDSKLCTKDPNILYYIGNIINK